MRRSSTLAIILDMDGLMLDTEPISLRVWRQAAQELGYFLDDEMCDPDFFLMAASRLHQRPEDCAVLEDSAPGIRAAVAAGMRAVLVPDGREPSEEARLEAYAVVESLSAARLVIEQMILQESGGWS